MKELFASSAIGFWGLLLFFFAFMAMLVWVFVLNKKEKLEQHGSIPLKDDNDER